MALPSTATTSPKDRRNHQRHLRLAEAERALAMRSSGHERARHMQLARGHDRAAEHFLSLQKGTVQ
jgi:hypothetical protein